MKLRNKLARRKKTRNKPPQLPTPTYVQTADDFDIMGLYAVRLYDEGACPSKKWFYDRARLNRYVIAQHTVESVRVVLRLK